MVLVDAVVVDGAGRHVTSLAEKDFTVLEDGKPQKIASFSAQQASVAKSEPPPPLLPPHVTTNRPQVTESQGTAAVLLLDGLNTPPQNQIYVRQQMLKFLAEHFDPRVRLAVLALTDRLTVLQDFTSNPLLLKAALENYRARSSAVARNGGEPDLPTMGTSPVANLPERAGAAAVDTGRDPGERSAGGSSSSIFQTIGYLMRRFEKEAQNFARETRISATLGALQEIARYTGGQPGRKVLLWFSTGFPVSVTGADPEDLATSRLYGDQIRRVTNLMNDAHITIYSIDANGLLAGGVADVGTPGRDAAGRISFGLDANKTLAGEAFARFAAKNTLEQAALDTGGRYFHDRNDLDRAISLSLQESASYYMLGYYPSNKKWDGKFREIKVKIARPGLQVRHRRGYFAVDPRDTRKQGREEELAQILRRGTLPSREVLFMARAVPPPRNTEVKVEFVVDPATILFRTEAENRRYCNLNFEVQAFTPDGKPVQAEVQSAEAPLLPQTYERVRRQGLPMQVPIKLAPGRYVLRLGVRDNLTGLIGTSALPIEVPAIR